MRFALILITFGVVLGTRSATAGPSQPPDPPAPDNGPPIACRLDAFDPEARRRHARLIDTLRTGIRGNRPLEEGQAFELEGGEASFLEAAEWITLERRCCPFLRFTLKWSGEGTPELHVTGPPEARDIILATFARDRT